MPISVQSIPCGHILVAVCVVLGAAVVAGAAVVVNGAAVNRMAIALFLLLTLVHAVL